LERSMFNEDLMARECDVLLHLHVSSLTSSLRK